MAKRADSKNKSRQQEPRICKVDVPPLYRVPSTRKKDRVNSDDVAMSLPHVEHVHHFGVSVEVIDISPLAPTIPRACKKRGIAMAS